MYSFYPQNINKEQENGPLLGYRISYECVNTAVTRRCSSTALNIKEVTGNGKTELNLGSLSSWTRYSLKVTVYNKIGDGPYSAIVNFTTLEERKSMYKCNSFQFLYQNRDMLVKRLVHNRFLHDKVLYGSFLLKTERFCAKDYSHSGYFLQMERALAHYF